MLHVYPKTSKLNGLKQVDVMVNEVSIQTFVDRSVVTYKPTGVSIRIERAEDLAETYICELEHRQGLYVVRTI